MLGMGAETVVDYALRFKSEFGTNTWVCGYADDMISYNPHAESGPKGAMKVVPISSNTAARPSDGKATSKTASRRR